MSKLLKAFKKWHNSLPGTKQHLDAIIALLTILLTTTLLLVNIKTLQSNKSTDQQKSQIIIATPAQGNAGHSTVVTSNPSPDVCKKGIAPLQITSPDEGETVANNPVCVSITYNQGTYCSAVWSYRFNGSTWSGYGNDAPCIYNAPSGTINFDLRVKSLVTSDTQTFHRSFVYQGTPPTQASSSATTQ